LDFFIKKFKVKKLHFFFQKYDIEVWFLNENYFLFILLTFFENLISNLEEPISNWVIFI